MTMTLNEQALKECPFCGESDYLEIRQDIKRNIFWHVWCGLCRFGSNEHPNSHEAVRAWNARALPPVSEWQPIETAPRDGTPILIAGQVPMAVTYEEGLPDWCPWAVIGASQVSIGARGLTHWMPLPSAPIAEAAGLKVEGV